MAHEGIRNILNLLDEDEVKQLALTTTQNHLKPDSFTTKNDAIEIIIRYSSDYSTIMNRKCVKRDILFKYCHDNHINLTAPVTKLSLIQKILDHWTKTSNQQQQIADFIENNTSGGDVVEKSDGCNKEDVNEMAEKFTEWFYNMLNADECISEEHFWQDCSLQIHLMSSENQSENCVESDRSQVVKTLFDTKTQYGLMFNPNLTSDGVYGKMDAHGLVVIFVCGTLHTKNNCVGVFEQIFALARDPFCENNWKIKNTRLNLSSKEVSETPKLCDSTLSNDLVLTLRD